MTYSCESNLGCVYDSSINVVIDRLVKPVITRTNGHLCVDGAVSLNVADPDDSASYIWIRKEENDLDFVPLAVGPTVAIEDWAAYKVTAQRDGCTQVSDQFIANDRLSDTSFEPVDVENKVCNGGSVLLSFSDLPERAYSWYSSSTPEGSAQLLPVTDHKLVAQTSGYYYGTISQGKCIFEGPVRHVIVAEPDSIFIPNVITPNGDGKNDEFIIQSNGEDINVSIFNRYGERLFMERSGFSAWNGETAPSGVYFWIVSLRTCEGEEKTYKGTLHILK